MAMFPWPSFRRQSLDGHGKDEQKLTSNMSFELVRRFYKTSSLEKGCGGRFSERVKGVLAWLLSRKVGMVG